MPELSEFVKNKGIKIFHQNIRGLFANFSGVQIILREVKVLDILTLSETHINNGNHDDEESLYEIPGYEFIKMNRKEGRAGGVAIYISNMLKWQRRYDLELNDVECIWIEIFLHKAKSFLLSTLYRPPEGSKYLPPNFNEKLMLSKVSLESKECIIMGDINIDYLKKKTDIEVIKSMFTLYGFKKLVKIATRITTETSTLIDVIMSNNMSNIMRTRSRSCLTTHNYSIKNNLTRESNF